MLKAEYDLFLALFNDTTKTKFLSGKIDSSENEGGAIKVDKALSFLFIWDRSLDGVGFETDMFDYEKAISQAKYLGRKELSRVVVDQEFLSCLNTTRNL